ncbi:putative RPN2-26S proteasome regulatory subunit [Tilletiaria anomala UBC 951]|uniref:26S proteasome regulatory subunit RPN2 n=1 Tax=Tilletiaria anomala (strain ATCC 24038 / CBS 436.72 / UBC 951) TaxID=1037660 RepID=A0A066V7M3_TILAU|nr:putative RPN2-26S proteasome regulatory subunit [Tilletiaria anomala UBC 951]KDN37461.1 putative RPN2-26S proteasome regulatory subunit [Tilletiaria anomala UBC 951]
MVVPISSAVGVITLLDEEEPGLQSYALKKLNDIVHHSWAEIADSVAKIETLHENPSFPDRHLAALVASKVYFHLGEFDEALSFALGAGPLFDVEKQREDEYVETVVSKAIDSYIAIAEDPQGPASQGKDEAFKAGLAKIVDQMFDRCITDKEHKQALGIALECRRLDIIQKVFEVTKDVALLTYIQDAVMGVVQTLDFRNQVLHLLVRLYQTLSAPDYFSIAQCYVYLNAPQLASDLLYDLVQKAHRDGSSKQANTQDDPLLIAYQVAFDLAESATQEFLETIRSHLQSKGQAEGTGAAKQETEDAVKAAEDEDMNLGEDEESTVDSCLDRIRSILLGEESIQLYLDFLQRTNHTDLLVLKTIKDSLDARNSVYHSAMTFANAFTNAGTTSDRFLRDNLDWLAKASNWSKFTATAALGVINKGNLKEGISILRPYLPQDGTSSSVYSEGGSLFALGLIHANHGTEVMELLKKTLKNNAAEIVQHGAALGLGAAGMATGNEEVYEELRNVLFTDSAIAGEAAGYAMGLVMLGTGNERAVEEMLEYAHETSHEKITRGLAMGLALLFYGKEEQADAMIDTLVADKDAILRYGGIYCIALAYAGTGNNKAIRRLLHIAVSDVSDDVRRAAVTSLGFLLFRNPTQVPRIVQLLSESFNPHVRYGSTLALGIACAGTGLEEALELLEPMTKDPVDFVRQGACISLAMILIQQNEVLNPRTASARKTFEKIMGDKHEDAMAKFGAALGQGLIDAGGRNVTISLQSRGGSNNMPAIVGMALFNQFWYWFPLAHFASLAFTPTALIGLNRDLRIPEFDFVSNARPSLFAYPTPVKPPAEKKQQKIETAVLSTTVKAQARQRTKEKAKAAEEGMDVDEKETPRLVDIKIDEIPKDSSEAANKQRRKRKPEPSFEVLANYSRVTPAQVKFITFPQDGRLIPIRSLMGYNNRDEVYDMSTIIGKRFLGVDTPQKGASGHVTPLKVPGKPQNDAAPAVDGGAGKDGTGTASNASGPTPVAARSILGSSNAGSGGGILLLIDRRPNELLTPLNIFGDANVPDGTSTGPSTAVIAEQGPDSARDDSISPEDAAAIARAMQMDDDDEEDASNQRMGVDQPKKDDRPGSGSA